jgi:hypothetical protein
MKEKEQFIPFNCFSEMVNWSGVLEWLDAHPVEDLGLG